MALDEINVHERVTQAQFGVLVGISQPAVSDCLTRGVLSREGTCADWLREYCSNLREQAAGRAAMGDLDLAEERAKLAREQRVRLEMLNAQTRKELAPIGLLESSCAVIGRRVSAVLEAIPGQIKRRSPHLRAEDIDAIEAEISKARNIAAAMKLDEEVDGLFDDSEERDTAGGDEGV